MIYFQCKLHCCNILEESLAGNDGGKTLTVSRDVVSSERDEYFSGSLLHSRFQVTAMLLGRRLGWVVSGQWGG